jgi:hypothetical protein
MLPLVGTIFLLDLLFPFVPTLLQYLAFGALFGVAGGRGLVVRRERRSGEMPPDRVRRFELVGTLIGVSVMFFAAAVQAALAHL